VLRGQTAPFEASRSGHAPWRSTVEPESPVRPFTVIEPCVSGNKTDEGSMSVAADIARDAAAGTITRADYDVPVLLESVKRQP
jgi:hypothetical protein